MAITLQCQCSAYIVNASAYIVNASAYNANASAYIVNVSAYIVNVSVYNANASAYIVNASACITAEFKYLNHICRKGTAMLCPYRVVYLPENSCKNATRAHCV